MYRPFNPSMRHPTGYRQAVSPTIAPPYFMGAVPTNVAPVQRIVHPTRVEERRRATRYPVENIYPTHTVNIHDHICEYSYLYPHTQSHKNCYYSVTTSPTRRRVF